MEIFRSVVLDYNVEDQNQTTLRILTSNLESGVLQHKTSTYTKGNPNSHQVSSKYYRDVPFDTMSLLIGTPLPDTYTVEEPYSWRALLLGEIKDRGFVDTGIDDINSLEALETLLIHLLDQGTQSETRV